MLGQRKRYSAELKARVALEAIKGQRTANEIAAEYGVHPTQIAQWKKQALDGLPDVFSTRASEQAKTEEALIARLYQQIGQLKVQVDWLEKNQKHSIEAKRTLIEPEHPQLSSVQQCELLGLARSSYYYEPAEDREENLQLLRLLDEQYTRTPFYGTRKATRLSANECGDYSASWAWRRSILNREPVCREALRNGIRIYLGE